MNLVFTNEEKEKMQITLETVIADLRSIYELSSVDVMRQEFKINGDAYRLVINNKEMYIKKLYSDWWTGLEKVRPKKDNKVLPISDYNVIFNFLKKYEDIRSLIIHQAESSSKNKQQGISVIDQLLNKYSKEATIEVEMPETVNQSSIEVLQADGQNIGHVKVGPISLKIFASKNVNIVNKKQESYVKRKK